MSTEGIIPDYQKDPNPYSSPGAGGPASPTPPEGGEPVMWVPARVLEAVQYRGTTAIAASNSQNEVTDTPLYTHPSLPAGHVAVPVEPTEAMVKAISYELCLQRGLFPHKTDNGGVELWETFKPMAKLLLAEVVRVVALPNNQGEGK